MERPGKIVPALLSGCIVFLFTLQAGAQKVPYSQAVIYQGSVGEPVVAPDGLSFYTDIDVFDPSIGTRRSGTDRYGLDGNRLECDIPRTGVFSPDGAKIAFKGVHDGSYGLWIYSRETQQYTLAADVPESNAFLGHRARKNFDWSPDGRYIAYVAAEKKPVPAEGDIKIISRILFKTRTSLSDNLRTHLFVVPAEGGSPKQLTFGDYDEHSLDWSPDGSRIAFISNRTADPDNNHNNDIWTVDVARGTVKRLTDTPGTEFSPAYSPDGRLIAYLGGVRSVNTKDSPPENNQLRVMPAGGGTAKNLTGSLDRRVAFYRWAPDNRRLFFTANDRGGTHLFCVDTAGGLITPVVDGDVRVRSFDISRETNRIVYLRTDPLDPGEIWSASLEGKNRRRLTGYQEFFTKKARLSAPETLWFSTFDSTMVQGWLMKPVSFDPDKKYPLILTVHGGPHGAYGFSFSGSSQLFVENGFGVLFINPRGSTGYGQKFADGTINNWGGGDYRDLMAGVDYALEHNDWIDPARLGVTGGSYGGFMTNWIITQTDRFKAAVSVASLSNLVSFYGTSLYQLLIETEFPGKFWDNFDLLWRWSPLKYVRNVSTPTLFIHGENDHDVPITQAEEMYIALKKRGVESVLVRYPGEGHGFHRREHIDDLTARRLEWFTAHLQPEKTTGK